MKLAFCLLKYFPQGGLQQEFINIAQACIERGHHIDVYTLEWQGQRPQGFNIYIIPKRGWTNHSQSYYFAQQVNAQVNSTHYDKVIGFNKMPGLDIYFAADDCIRANPKYNTSLLRRLLPRYRTYLKLEQAVLDDSTNTQILVPSERSKQQYLQYYPQASQRLQVLPPGISRAVIPSTNYESMRQSKRHQLGVQNNDWLLISIASYFQTKGIDRHLKSLQSLPKSLQQKIHFAVIGHDNPQPYQSLLPRYARVEFLGGRQDIPELLWASDLMLHLARADSGGKVILEALAAGVPVLATDCCGYAQHISQAQAGVVLKTPFEQQQADQQLQQSLHGPTVKQWHHQALHYSQTKDLYSLVERTLAFIEDL